MDLPNIRFKEKSVIIHRDENGFGLRVGGQNPVFVDCVHENGAAWKAGVRKDDRIIKVNGTLVRSYNHHRVVEMIQKCTPFVNLTLHSPEPIATGADCSGTGHSYTLGVDQNNGNVIAVGISDNQNNQSNNVHLQLHNHNHNFNHPHPSSSIHLNQWCHPHSHPPTHSLQGNLNWLLDIGDDLFQDNQQQKQSMQLQQQKQEQNLIPVSQQQQPVSGSGVSKLIVSGPTLLSHSNSNASSSASSSNKHNRSQSNNNNTRDNPYYYYKTAAQQQQQQLNENKLSSSNDATATSTTCNTSNHHHHSITNSSSSASLLNNPIGGIDLQQQHTSNATATATIKASSSSSSMVRSKSSSKISTRSTTSKYAKARKRLVEDLKSLAITNSQATPSSSSSSPSSSDLSDCDDIEPVGTIGRLTECGLILNSSNLSTSPNSSNTIMIGSTAVAAAAGLNLNSSLQQAQHNLYQQQQQQQQQQPLNSGTFNVSSNNNKSVRITTRRLEIIRELVDTEKTHTEKLKQLNDLLYKPIKKENLISPDQLKMVFSCHKTLFKIHRQIYKKLLAAQVNYSEQPQHFQQPLQEPLVGKALIEIFDGELGRRLEKAASLFCACQSTNTELLNRITRKDTKSGEFLAQVANQQMLGRLGIKDLLASCFQRLTKYPLLLDNLLKATPNLSPLGSGPSGTVDAATASLAAASPSSSATMDQQQQLAGMIHSKSLSEGSIAIPLNSATNAAAANISNINNSTVNDTSNINIDSINDESGQELLTPNEQSANDSTLVTSKSLTSAIQSKSPPPSPTSTTIASSSIHHHYESFDELQVSDSSSAANMSTSSTLSAVPTTSAAATGETLTTPAAATLTTVTTSISDEYAYERFCIERALQSSRQILIHVNEAVNRAIAQNKLKDIWKKTDKNPSLPVINIESQQLLHEGSLILRLNRRQFEVYVLLLTHYLIILTRENQDKYKLKCFTSDGKSIPNTQFSPIFNIDEHLVTRDSATDENGFYLLCKRKDDSRIYEFASRSPLERAKWKEKIHMAQMYNFAMVPDDDNTLTRYTELISLTNSGNTPNNIEHSPTGSLATTTTTTSSSSTSVAAATTITTTIATSTSTIPNIVASQASVPSMVPTTATSASNYHLQQIESE